MTRTTRVAVSLSAVAIAAVGGTTTGAVAAPATVHVHAAAAATSTLHATINKNGLTLTGDRSIKASRVTVTLKAKGGERELAIARFKKGYSFKALVRDEKYFFKHGGGDGQPTKKALARLHRAIRLSTFAGGIDGEAGSVSKETLLMTKGKYIVYNDGGNLPDDPQTITVTGTKHNTKAPKTSGTVFMKKNQNRFGGSKVLPAKGTIEVINKNVHSPHFLAMLHVKKGTTRKQFLEGLESQSPTIFLPGSTGTDALSSGQSQTLKYSLPKGTYGQACFFPDPVTGIPHAFMGMVRIVTVK
jgi:hypothetical protein